MPSRTNNCPLFIFVGFWLSGQLFGLLPKAQADLPLGCGIQSAIRVCLYRKVMQAAGRIQNKITRMECNSLKVDDDQAFYRLGVCH
jgi:hypothetical protein